MNYGPIVTLPIGLRPSSGGVFREVHLDQMRTKDQELLADKKLKGNGAMAISLLLRRCIQAIPGFLPQKERKNDLLDASVVRQLAQPDRDYLVAAIRAMEGKTETNFQVQCPSCGTRDVYSVDLSDVAEYQWPDEEPLTLPVLELPFGLVNKEGVLCKKITLRIMTGADSEALAAQPDNRRMTALIAASCVNLEGFGKLDSESAGQMLMADTEAISEHMSMNLPGLDLMHNDTCSNCGGEISHGIDLSSFLSPKKAQNSTSGAKRLRRS
jgi:hypothetical protein